MDRFEKMEWLKETCSEEFLGETLMDEIVMWMSDEDFSKFYDHLCGCWDIAGSSAELEAQMNA
jgi:hypothetical protein